jgi:hypothetical protein
MTSWDERMTSRPPHGPILELVATLFRVQGTTRRPLRCALYHVETGLELRLEYENRGDLLHSQLFRVRDDNVIAVLADTWHQALIAKGFEELPDEESEGT